MDSANWQILDTYQLEEYEQGMSMSVMTLSDVSIICSLIIVHQILFLSQNLILQCQ